MSRDTPALATTDIPGRAGHRPTRCTWRWLPPRSRWRSYLVLGGTLALLFLAVYGGMNYLTSLRASRLALFFSWEMDIPFVPQMIFGYASLFLLFLLPPFALAPDALTDLARRFVTATLIAGLCFLLLPAQLGYARHEVAGSFAGLYHVIYALDFPHNLVPSLHVAYSTLILAALAAVSPVWARALLGSWLVVICLSTVLVHQHHLLDVVSGLVLGAWLHRRPPLPWSLPGGAGKL